MTIFITIKADSIDLFFQAESDQGDKACCFETIRPGEKWFDIPYETFLQHGNGALEIENKTSSGA